MKSKILQTIEEFKSADPAAVEYKYLNGDCYVFARALAEKFDGNIYYLAIDNHFITLIDNDFYDIRGFVPSDEIYECYLWEEYCLIDPLDAARVEYYCIQGKENFIFEDL